MSDDEFPTPAEREVKTVFVERMGKYWDAMEAEIADDWGSGLDAYLFPLGGFNTTSSERLAGITNLVVHGRTRDLRWREWREPFLKDLAGFLSWCYEEGDATSDEAAFNFVTDFVHEEGGASTLRILAPLVIPALGKAMVRFALFIETDQPDDEDDDETWWNLDRTP